MIYLMDTDILSLAMDGHPRVTQRIRRHPTSQLAMSIVCVDEILSGWYTMLRQCKSDQQIVWAYGRMTDAMRFMAGVQILTYDQAAADEFRTLKASKIRVKTMDLRIASTALATGAILVSRNRSDFERVPGLQLEDWSQP